MLEQKLEENIINKIQTALTSYDVQIIGAWQQGNDGIKGLEHEPSAGYITVSVHPRAYQTPTIPDANFIVDINILLKADVDYNGQDYIAVNQAIFNIFQSWQTSYASYNSDLNVANEFNPTGITMNGGSAGIDRDNTIWRCDQQLTIYGIIL